MPTHYTPPHIYYGTPRDNAKPESKQPMRIDRHWHIRWSHRHHTTGRMQVVQRKLGINRFKTLSSRLTEARAALTEVEKMLAEGHYPFADGPQHSLQHYTFAQALQWACDKKIANGGITPDHAGTLRNRTAMHIAAITHLGLQHIPLQHVTRQHIRTLLEHLQHTRRWNNITYNCHKITIGTLFNVLVDEEAITHTPLLRLPAKETKPVKPFIQPTPQQQAAIAAYLRPHMPGLLIALMLTYQGGARHTTLIHIRVGWINWQRRIIEVPAQYTKDEATVHLPLTADIMELLPTYVTGSHPTHYLFGIGAKPGPRPYKDSQSLQNIYAKHINKHLGIPAQWYGHKHSGAGAKLDTGKIDLAQIGEQFDHSSTTTTRHYTPAGPSRSTINTIIEHAPSYSTATAESTVPHVPLRPRKLPATSTSTHVKEALAALATPATADMLGTWIYKKYPTHYNNLAHSHRRVRNTVWQPHMHRYVAIHHTDAHGVNHYMLVTQPEKE